MSTTHPPGTTLTAQGPEPAAVHQLLRFTLGRLPYAVEIGAVREILQVASLTCVPMLPAFVRGVMNLRGAVVPVIDLAARLGLGSTRLAPRTCVVVVDIHRADHGDGHAAAPQRLGMLVDAVHEVLDVPARDLEPVPAMGTRIHADFIRSMARVRGQIVEVLNLDQALDQDHLSEMIGAHLQARTSQIAAAQPAPAWAPQALPGVPPTAAALSTAPHPRAVALAA
jgi:purine-binding chemotaxis protein CheW